MLGWVAAEGGSGGASLGSSAAIFSFWISSSRARNLSFTSPSSSFGGGGSAGGSGGGSGGGSDSPSNDNKNRLKPKDAMIPLQTGPSAIDRGTQSCGGSGRR